MTSVNSQPGTVDDILANGKRLIGSDPSAAAAQAQAILRVDRDNSDALRLLGAALRRMNRPREAERAELEAIRTSAHRPVLAQAALALRERRFAAAEQMLLPYIRRHPDDAAANMILGEIAASAGADIEAEALLRKALVLAPAYAAARLGLARLLLSQNRTEETIAALDAILERDPENISTLRFKATALGRMGEHEGAITLYEALLDRDPALVPVWISYGDALRTVGRRHDSIEAYRRAIALDGTSGRAWWSLTNLKSVDLGEDDIAAMTSAIERSRDSEDRLHLHFALGRTLESVGRFDQSFGHYAEGNRVRRSGFSYNPQTITDEVRRSTTLFTSEFFEQRAGQGCLAPDPIFILGMPRSGSTLIEQILASHTMIEGTSELPLIPILIQQLMREGRRPVDASYRDSLPELPAERLRSLGERYLEKASPYRKTKRPFFTDKLPHNWGDIGFIHLILPGARIIDARRAPLDCCFSNFRQHFAQGHPASYSLEEMGLYYRDYVRLLQHFDTVLPGRIHRLFHEELVEDPDAEVRRLLEFLGLPFEPACLRFYETERSVTTASSEQVRRPLNREGLGSWKPYEPWLDPLKQALEPVLDCYPAAPMN